jgi:hypothetical protein
MAINDPLKAPLNIDDLLLSKRLEPIAPDRLTQLAKAAARDVTTYSEMEVRWYIIDPIVEALDIDETLEAEELRYLSEHIYMQDVDLYTQVMTAVERYSVRA